MNQPPLVLAEVIALYLTHARHEQAVRTYEGRKHVLHTLNTSLGSLALSEAKPFHLRLWVDSQSQWKSDWTKKGAVSTVQRCLNWAAKLGLIDRNPFLGVSHCEGEPGRAMTDHEFRAALRGTGPPFRRVLAFLRFTGCRPCELSALEAANIDHAQGIAVLAIHKTSKTQKVKRPRVIVLHPVARKLIGWCGRNLAPGQVKLFVNSRGRPWTRYAMACRMKRLRKKLNLPRDCKTYGLRHKFGTDAILNGVEIKTLSVLMGHTTTRTSERYIHIGGEIAHLTEALMRVIGKR